MKIRETREAAKLSQAEIAKQLGISTDKFVQIEDGVIEPTVSQLLNLANIFGVSVDYLLEHSTPISQGEKTWLNVRSSLPEDKLRTIAQMLNGVNDLQLNEEDINNICNTDKDRLSDCGSEAKLVLLFNSTEEDVLTFDDYLVLKKIADGEDIYVSDKDLNILKTNYSFTYGGKFYSSMQVSKILYRLEHKFDLLNGYFTLKKTQQGYKSDNKNYFSLNKKAKALLKAKEEEIKSKSK